MFELGVRSQENGIVYCLNSKLNTLNTISGGNPFRQY